MFNVLLNKYAACITIGIIIGFVIGSIWINKDQDEMLRQMAQVVMIARGM